MQRGRRDNAETVLVDRKSLRRFLGEVKKEGVGRSVITLRLHIDVKHEFEK